MPVHNSEIAKTLNQIADLLDIRGENQFRIRAYRNAARTIGGLSQGVADMIGRGEDLSRLPGIGKDLAGKIREIVETGKLSLLEELKQEIPAELGDIMKVPGLGPKKVHVLHEKLGITSLEQLRDAAKEGKIEDLPGFGRKTEDSILDELGRMKGGAERIKIAVAEEIADSLLDFLKKAEGVKDIAAAGSYRRRQETVGDLDILVTCRKGSKVMDHFVGFEDVDKVISKGETRSSVVLRSGLHVDLRVVLQISYGAALHYFTGSKAHNIEIRKLGMKKDCKINEYGVFKGDRRIAGRTEEEVYGSVGLPFIEPELRENRGEIEAARDHKLPRLITLDDIRGDLHCHTSETDGKNRLQEMAKAARDRGYEYLAVTDHTKRVAMAHGFDAKRLGTRIREIDRLNERLTGFRVLKSAEVDILEDGSLDLPDDILAELDLTVCAVHYNFKLPRQKQTERIIRAMDNPNFSIFSHPSGRLINEREPYDVDMERIMEAAQERGRLLELNAQPDRLDLTDIHCKTAKEMGIKIAISTDAHSIRDLDFMRFGIGQARRGWLEPDDVVNTRGLKGLLKLLGK
jgi:DNA polymerase (family 10)